MTEPFVECRDELFRKYYDADSVVDAPTFRSVDQLSGAVAECDCEPDFIERDEY